MDDPDAVTNEVFVAVFRGLDRFRGDESAFRGWVFAIARNKAIDAIRWRARRPESPVAVDPALRGGDVEEEATRRLGTEWVVETLDRLTPGQRDVLLLRLVSQLTIDEIALAVGKPAGAVKALQRRALHTLQRLLTDKGVPL